MKRIKISAEDLSIEDLVAYARQSKAKLESETTFDSLESDLAKLGAATTILEKRHEEHKLADQIATAKLSQRDDQRKIVITLLTAVGAGVENVAAGDTDILRSSPFALRVRSMPIGPLPAPQDLRAIRSDRDGEIKLRWKAVPGRKTYLVEVALIGTTEWMQGSASTRASTVLKYLESGKKYRIRVRGIGAAGPGAWSEEVVQMAA